MKKRLRKKKHVDEFQMLGFEIRFRISNELSNEEHIALIDAFISDAIEFNGLLAGGFGGRPISEGFVTVDNAQGSAKEVHRKAVRAWLESNPRISEVWVGELRDAWYGWDE